MTPALPGFESINRYWDRRLQRQVAKILPGEYYVTISEEAITTVLGSCVAACIRDPVQGVGGMNHFMLPLRNGESWSTASELESLANRYGNYAMEHMITDILKRGGRKRDLEVKLFGGAHVIRSRTEIGDSNILFVRNFLELEEIDVIAEDLGGQNPRKIMYFPDTGKVLVKKLKDLHNDTIVDREQAYMANFGKDRDPGVVDIFGSRDHG